MICVSYNGLMITLLCMMSKACRPLVRQDAFNILAVNLLEKCLQEAVERRTVLELNLKKYVSILFHESYFLISSSLCSDGACPFNTFKYHVFTPMGRFQLELIYLYFLPSLHQTVVVCDLQAFRCYNIINRYCGC